MKSAISSRRRVTTATEHFRILSFQSRPVSQESAAMQGRDITKCQSIAIFRTQLLKISVGNTSFFAHAQMEACYDFEQEQHVHGGCRRRPVDLGQRRPFFFALAQWRNLNGRWSLPFTIRFAVMHLFARGCFSLARSSATHSHSTPLHSVMMRH